MAFLLSYGRFKHMRLPFILFTVFMVVPTHISAQKLSDYKWKHRIIILMNGESPKVKEQLALFTSLEKELADRDLIILRYEDGKVLDGNSKTTDMDVNSIPYPDYNGLLLIGKDGGVKLKKPFVVVPNEVFALIDSMPMRRAEMKNGS